MNLKQKKMEEINRNKTQNWALERETWFPSPLASISFRSAVRNGGFSPPLFFNIFHQWHQGWVAWSQFFFSIDLASVLPSKPPTFGSSAANYLHRFDDSEWEMCIFNLHRKGKPAMSGVTNIPISHLFWMLFSTSLFFSSLPSRLKTIESRTFSRESFDQPRSN